MTSFTRMLAACAVAATIAAPVSAFAADKLVKKEQYSGFLKDYSQLKEEEDAGGKPVMRYLGPKLTAGAYRQVMLDRVDYYPEPRPDAEVDAATLEQIRGYLDRTLRQKIGEKVPVVDRAGPGVVRLRLAITAVAAETRGLKPRPPIGMLIQGIKAAAGTGPLARDAELYAELEVLDSQSNERIGAVVKKGIGTELKAAEGGKGEKKVVLDNLKPVLDDWAKLAADFAGANLRPQ